MKFIATTTLLACASLTTVSGSDCGPCFIEATGDYNAVGGCESAKTLFNDINSCLEESCELDAETITVFNTAKAAANLVCSEAVDVGDYPLLDCALCIHGVFEGASAPGAGAAKCNALNGLLKETQRCRESRCQLDSSAFESNVEAAIEGLSWLEDEECDDDVDDLPWFKCKKCVASAVDPIREADPEEKCAKAADALDELEDCKEEECEDDLSPFLEGLEEAIEAMTANGTVCEIEADDHPTAACQKCIHTALNATFSKNDTSEALCETAERLLDALEDCRESDVCEDDPTPLEHQMPRVQRLLEKLDDSCDVDLDDLPILACNKCRIEGLKDLLEDVEDGEVCEVAEATATIMRDCNKGSCKNEGERLEETLRRLRELAGEECVLNLEDLPISNICRECLEEFVEHVKELKLATGDARCTAVPELVATLKRCKGTCGVKITNSALGEPLRELYKHVKEEETCSTEDVQAVESYAKQQSVDLEETPDNTAGSTINSLAPIAAAFALVASFNNLL